MVAMHQGCAWRIAEDVREIAAAPSGNQSGFLDVIFRQSARQRAAIVSADRDEVAAPEIAFDASRTRREQARATAQRLGRAGIDMDRAPRGQPAGEPRLARRRALFGDE